MQYASLAKQCGALFAAAALSVPVYFSEAEAHHRPFCKIRAERSYPKVVTIPLPGHQSSRRFRHEFLGCKPTIVEHYWHNGRKRTIVRYQCW